MGDYQNQTIQTNLTYSDTADYGHASANKKLCLGKTGANAALVGDREKILGVFLELRRNKKATVQTASIDVELAGDQNAFRVGAPVVGAGNGKAKSPTVRTNSYVQNTEEEWANARGFVLEIISNVASGSVARVFLY